MRETITVTSLKLVFFFFFFNWSYQLLESYFCSPGRSSLRKSLSEVLHFVSFLYIPFRAFGAIYETT